METDSAGWVIWRRRFGRGGSWANAGATRTAHTISIGMLRTALVASNKFSPSPTMQSTPADLRRHLFSGGRCASPSPGDGQTVNATWRYRHATPTWGNLAYNFLEPSRRIGVA